MWCFRLVLLGFAALMLCAKAADRLPIAASEIAPLEGAWVIISVERDGMLDYAQLGATLTFSNKVVDFLPGVEPAPVVLNEFS